MTHTDFQERLNRIGAKSTPQPTAGAVLTQSKRTNAKRPGMGRLILGASLLAGGMQAVKYANVNYDVIKNSGGVGMAAFFGLGGMLSLLIGGYLLVTGSLGKKASAQQTYAMEDVASGREASTRARVICSLLGFFLGFAAFGYVLLAAAATTIDTEMADNFTNGGLVLAILFAVLSLLIGLIGLFVRGFALGRVPVYFVFGVILTFVSVKLFRVNPLEWAQFVDLLQ